MDFSLNELRFAPRAYTNFILRRLRCKGRFAGAPARHSKAFHVAGQEYRNELVYVLSRKYRDEIAELKSRYAGVNPHGNPKSRNVWFCWLQGIDNNSKSPPPPIVLACLNSLRRVFGDRVTVIDGRNFTDYIELPGPIVDKYKSGVISPALFSDLIRLRLLNRYGGTWIDATILCTAAPAPYIVEDSEFFIFRTVHMDAYNSATRIESWFISSVSAHPLLLFTQELLEKYCLRYSFAADYLIFYDFFELACEAFPGLWGAASTDPRANALLLHESWGKPYTPERFAYLTSKSPFHKLSYRYLPEKDDPGDIYHYILRAYGENGSAGPR